MTHSFVADVGGTNIRIATVDNGQLVDICKMLCSQFETIDEAIRHYYAQYPERTYRAGCIGIACPVNDDLVTMTNHSWSFSKRALQASVELEHLSVINDFTAVAHSLPMLSGDQVLQIGEGNAVKHANIAVFGPGTGLGVEHLTHTEQGWKTLDGEGGHVDFAPTSEEEVVVWRYLKTKLGRASTEEVLSGRGIQNIYHALCEHTGQPATKNEPAEITAAALNDSCSVCRDTLGVFCRVMGNFAGDLALNLATFGGVFIGGGIAARFTDFLRNSQFRECFESKGVVASYVSDIPTFLIMEPDHGLIGAYAYLNQQLARMDHE